MKKASFLLAAVCLTAFSGCDWMPGNPKHHHTHEAPAEITSFDTLFKQNCNGCHGTAAEPSASIVLNDPLYLSLIPKDKLRQIIANGVPNTPMPAFAMSNGGTLTDTAEEGKKSQIDILVEGISAWAKPAPAGAPPYAAPLGDAARGGEIIAQFGANFLNTSAKGPNGNPTGLADPAFLGLSSDQYLRTLVIVGRPELGFADYRTRIPGRAMTNEDISDVVAWLVAQRKNEFGQFITPPSAAPAAPTEPAAPAASPAPSQP